MPVTYEIRAGKSAPCELWKLSRFGDVMIAEGTHTFCKQIMEGLK
jgi:hypothetical protein